MYKSQVYFDFALPIAVKILELPYQKEQEGHFFFQEHLKMILILSGSAALYRKGKTVKYTEKEIILLDSNVLFSIKALKKNTVLLSVDVDCNYYKKIFPHIIGTVFNEHTEDPDDILLTQLLNVALSVMESEVKNYSYIDNATTDILKNILDTRQAFYPVIISNYKNKDTQSEYIYLMQQVLHYMNVNYEQKLSLSHLADKNLLNSNYLSHLFKKISGKTFNELVAYVRCLKSEMYLIKSDWKISEVSYEVGFSLPDYYKKSFLKTYGISPQEHREIYFNSSDNKTDIFEYSHEQGIDLIKVFAHDHQINIDSFSGRIFSIDNVNISNSLSIFASPFSEIGETKNIGSEMSERAQQAFINMQKEFRMQGITIEGDEIFMKSIENSGLTIAKNIDYLINSGFDIIIVLRKDSPHYITALTNFMTFYSRRFKNTLKYISCYLEINADKQRVELFRKQLYSRLSNELGISFMIFIHPQDTTKFNCAPFLYDSFVLTPFAMDELFHFDNWPGELAFSMLDPVNKSGNIMAGGNGLLTWNGIKKPWWHAYRLAAKLRGNIISAGADHIVTNENNDIVILTYNLCGFSPVFLKTIDTKEKLYEIARKKNNTREHHFRLDSISGTYKVIRYTIDITSCLFVKWAKLGYPEYLSSEEEQIIAETSYPKVDFDKISINGKHEISLIEESFGVSCMVLEKLY